VLYLFRTAHREKLLKAIVPDYRRLQQENAQLKAKLQNTNPDQVMAGVARALRQPQHLTAAPGSASSSAGMGDLSDSEIAKLDDATIERLLKTAAAAH
jgi:phosphoglucomutase